MTPLMVNNVVKEYLRLRALTDTEKSNHEKDECIKYLSDEFPKSEAVDDVLYYLGKVNIDIEDPVISLDDYMKTFRFSHVTFDKISENENPTIHNFQSTISKRPLDGIGDYRLNGKKVKYDSGNESLSGYSATDIDDRASANILANMNTNNHIKSLEPFKDALKARNSDELGNTWKNIKLNQLKSPFPVSLDSQTKKGASHTVDDNAAFLPDINMDLLQSQCQDIAGFYANLVDILTESDSKSCNSNTSSCSQIQEDTAQIDVRKRKVSIPDAQWRCNTCGAKLERHFCVWENMGLLPGPATMMALRYMSKHIPDFIPSMLFDSSNAIHGSRLGSITEFDPEALMTNTGEVLRNLESRTRNRIKENIVCLSSNTEKKAKAKGSMPKSAILNKSS